MNLPKHYLLKLTFAVLFALSNLLAILIIFAVAAAEVELPPNPPGFRLASITDTNGPSASLIYSEARRSAVKESLTTQTNFVSFQSPDRQQRISRKDGAESRDDAGTIVAETIVSPVKSSDSGNNQTNDAPVRAWHGAMVAPTKPQQIPLTGGSVTFVTTNLISVNGVVDIEELSRAVAFRRTTIPPPAMLPPPMPASTNTLETATMRAMNTPYRETPAQRAQRMFFEQGGQKGRK